MKYIIGFFVTIILFSCSMKSPETAIIEKDNNSWTTHHDTIDAGFILTFKYPNNVIFADVIDNCRCVGEKIKNEDKIQGTDSTNTRLWCICMQDTADYPIEYFISSWKSLYDEQAFEQRDTLTIDETKALRVTLKSKNKNTSDRQLIYLKKYSTLFEIMNTKVSTEKDFETFCKSIKIEEYKRK